MNKIEKIKLDNGLTIYLYLDKRKHTTFVNLATKYGGVIKEFKLDGKIYHVPDGIAHLLEHYIVESNEVGEYTKILGQRHMSTNATTSYKVTSFFFEGIKDIDFGIQTLLTSCYSPIFNEENLKRVKLPIYQEIRMYEDNKFYKFNKIARDSLLKNYDFRSITGTINDVASVDIELLQTVFKAFYQPKNQILTIAGNFDKKKVLEQIKNIYAKIKVEDHNTEITKIYEPNKVAKKKSIIKLPTAQTYAEVAYKVDLSNFTNEERLKLDFYINYFFKMTFGITSGYYKEQLAKKIISSPVDIGQEIINNYIILSIGCFTDKPNHLIRSIKKEMKSKKGLSEEKFKSFVKESAARIAVRPENIHSMISPFLWNIIDFNIEKLDSVEYISSFNYDEFLSLLNRLNFKHYTITIMKNDD